jgi:hypothetical protein
MQDIRLSSVKKKVEADMMEGFHMNITTVVRYKNSYDHTPGQWNISKSNTGSKYLITRSS